MGCCSVEAVPCWHHNSFRWEAGAGTDHNIVIVLISPVCRLGGTDHNIVIVLISPVCRLVQALTTGLHCFVWGVLNWWNVPLEAICLKKVFEPWLQLLPLSTGEGGEIFEILVENWWLTLTQGSFHRGRTSSPTTTRIGSVCLWG